MVLACKIKGFIYHILKNYDKHFSITIQLLISKPDSAFQAFLQY